MHDPDRPQPPVAEPKYDGKPVPAPADAKILFDGTNLDNFKNTEWKLVDGAMQVVPKAKNQYTVEKFGDIHLHVEWIVPKRNERLASAAR